jgi:hypothetical protein
MGISDGAILADMTRRLIDLDERLRRLERRIDQPVQLQDASEAVWRDAQTPAAPAPDGRPFPIGQWDGLEVVKPHPPVGRNGTRPDGADLLDAEDRRRRALEYVEYTLRELRPECITEIGVRGTLEHTAQLLRYGGITIDAPEGGAS